MDDLPIGMHLGRIYETQGRKNDAIEMYLGALSAIPADQSLSDDAKETRKRLSDILGGYDQVDDRLQQSRKKKSLLRTVTITNTGSEQGIAQYTVIIDANSKVVDLAAVNSDDSLATLNDAIRAASMPQSFPDATLKKLLAWVPSPAHPPVNRAFLLCRRRTQLRAWSRSISQFIPEIRADLISSRTQRRDPQKSTVPGLTVPRPSI